MPTHITTADISVMFKELHVISSSKTNTNQISPEFCYALFSRNKILCSELIGLKLAFLNESIAYIFDINDYRNIP